MGTLVACQRAVAVRGGTLRLENLAHLVRRQLFAAGLLGLLGARDRRPGRPLELTPAVPSVTPQIGSSRDSALGRGTSASHHPGRTPQGRVRSTTPDHALAWARRVLAAVALVAVTSTGITIGALLGARGASDVGPFRVAFQLSPSTDGGTEIAIPPLGSLFLDSHDGPARLTVRLDSLDQRRTEALLDDPAGLAHAGATAPEDLRDALVRLGLRTLGVSVLASMLLAGLTFRSVRRVAWSGGLALLVTGGTLGTAALTVRPQALAEPRYEGLLVNAPALIGDAQRIADDYTRYAEQLQRLVGNVGELYATVSTLPIYQAAPDTTRILHVSDLHLNPAAWPMIRTVVEQYDIDLVDRHRGHHRLGQRTRDLVRFHDRPARRALRLRPRQPRLTPDRRGGGQPAERGRAG